ncbi:MAG: cupin domain-containing protein [Pseudomonadota bacterium]|jgi:anti-sigma factor ChrR (cupin superfamily)
MSESVKPEGTLAAEFALGLIRGPERKNMAARVQTDDALRSQVEEWEQRLAVLDDSADDDAGYPTPPAGQFEKILERIDAAGLQLPGTRTQRGTSAQWKEIGPGITSRVLHVDRTNNRISVLIRMVAGSTYDAHAHAIEEETLVIEGDWNIGDLHLKAGDYHVASTSAHHCAGHTVSGCLIHVVTSMAPQPVGPCA